MGTSRRSAWIHTDDAFSWRILRHRPSSLVPLIARWSARHRDVEEWLGLRTGKYSPWFLAEVARISLMHGRRFRRRAGASDLDSCYTLYRHMFEAEALTAGPSPVINFVLRQGHIAGYQEHLFNSLARTAAIFGEVTGEPSGVFGAGWDQQLLGCTLREYLIAAMYLHMTAVTNDGVIPTALDNGRSRLSIGPISVAKFQQIVSSRFATDLTEFRLAQILAWSSSGGPPGPEERRYTFNPLLASPAIRGVGGRLIVPIPDMIVRKASPLGLYYLGMKEWGQRFATALGFLFESYVGRQLQLVSGGRLLREIKYARDRLSIDWILILPECVLLVEVKSTRPTEAMRLGTREGLAGVVRMLDRAVSQLNVTASLIGEGHPRFAEVPADRPVLGLVVTMERIVGLDSREFNSAITRPSIPTVVCGSFELEGLVTMEDPGLGGTLVDLLANSEARIHSLDRRLHGRKLRRNDVLAAAWSTLPGPDDWTAIL